MAIVHRTEDVGSFTCLTCLLILYRTALVLLLNPLVCSDEVVAINSLVAQRPYYNRRMIVLHLYVVLIAFQNLLCKLRLLSSSIVAILEAVALLVGLCCYIKTIFVTKVVPYWVVWIVASTNGIDVQALHNLDILNHALARYYIASVWVHFVTVCTLDIYRLTIYKEL